LVSVTGAIDPETGYVIDMKVLADLITDEVENKLDHKNLNLDVPEFSDTIPTAENIAVFIYNALKKKLPLDNDLEVTLFETPRNSVTYSGL
jgi:6-pyruvoyltetrahydropterin/6-carboxytetrahydropterin synthase